jgi:hypothetical protein
MPQVMLEVTDALVSTVPKNLDTKKSSTCLSKSAVSKSDKKQVIFSKFCKEISS